MLKACKVLDKTGLAPWHRDCKSAGWRLDMKKRLLMLAAAAMTLLPMSAPAAVRVVVARPYYGYYGGFYRPYWGPYWGPAYYTHPNAGEVKLDTKVKDAQVYINGAYAGTTKENK